MNKNTKRVALSGVFSAAAVLLMAVGSVINILNMTCAFAAGFAVIITRIELDRTSALGVFAASGLLAFVLLPDKSVAMMFLCYGGLYPILKEFCEKIPNRIAQYTVKLIVSNALLTLMIWICRYFVTAGDEALGFEILVYIAGNFVFAVYDMALTLIISRYYKIFKHRQ